jgi:hypothetical protein
MFDQDPSVPAFDFIYSAYNAAINDPDTMSWSKAMRAADAEQFKHSAQVDIKALHDAGTWEIVDKTKATTKILYFGASSQAKLHRPFPLLLSWRGYCSIC